MVESLLIKRHGARATFGKNQTLFTPANKTVEKVAFQGHTAACVSVISCAYIQQALGRLLKDVEEKPPKIYSTIQTVRDIFAMITKSLDQAGRCGTFFT